MKKLLIAIAVVGALSATAAAPALAAELENGNNETCSGIGEYHFVNNQTRGAGAGVLYATFDTEAGLVTYMADAYNVSRNNQHFDVTTEGDATLVNAVTYTDSSMTTSLPGRLVLSDFECDGGKKDPPKK